MAEKRKYQSPSLIALSGASVRGQTEGSCLSGGRPYTNCVDGNVVTIFTTCTGGGFVVPATGCSPQGNRPGSLGCANGNSPDASSEQVNCSSGSHALTACTTGSMA